MVKFPPVSFLPPNNEGWKCPTCRMVWSPLVVTCVECNVKLTGGHTFSTPIFSYDGPCDFYINVTSGPTYWGPRRV
jgi:hypothetical protein